MISLYQLLEKIKERPGMYIGYPSVSELFMFLCGYKRACQDMELPLSDEEQEFHEFQPWLQKRFGVSTSASWARIILLYSGDEADGLKNFFDLLTEFRNERQQSSMTLPSDSSKDLTLLHS